MRAVLPLLAACGVEPSPVPLSDLSEVPTAACGAADHAWVDLAQTGAVVAWERAPELDASAAVLRGLLAAAEYPAEWLPLVHDVRVYRLRYLTQDRGALVEATALVSVPDAAGPFPTLAWLHGTTGFMDECAPSGAGLEGAVGNLLFSSLGAVVVAPDYLGMNGWGAPSAQLHPYLVAEPTALATLDAIRAGWSMVEADPSIDAIAERRVVLFGASEGGFAALWAERYAPWFLPEGEVVATVASVPPSDLTGLTTHAVTTLGPTSAALAAVLTAHRDWYGYAAPLSEALSTAAPWDLAGTLQAQMEATCDLGGAIDGVSEIAHLYEPGFAALAAAGEWEALGEWGCGLRANTLATAPFARASDGPVLYVISGADALVWHQTNRADVPRLCAQGYDLHVIECLGADHAEGAVASLHLQWAWARERLDGVPLESGCALPAPIDCAATPP